jgi:malate dehydrogenase (oxaloacetate-decarboxylating)(NADP+)
VNNVLGFPFIFRGALDVRARAITDEMKMAATRALAALAKEQVPDSVSKAYGGQRFTFGPEYIIPKPFDSRVLLWVAPAVAKAAMECGAARTKIDLDRYTDELRKRQSRAHEVMGVIFAKAKKRATRIVFTEGNQPKILQAAQILKAEGICEPILLGRPDPIRSVIEEMRHLDLRDAKIIDPEESELLERYATAYYQLRQRRGVTPREARKRLLTRNYFGAMMVREGAADGLVTGLTMQYPEAIRAPLEIIRGRDGMRAGGVYIVVTKNDFKFFSDCTLNIDPTAEELADIAIRTSDLASYFDVKPRVAMLSYSNFGSAEGESPRKVRKAVELVRKQRPDLEVDGEMEVDVAVLDEEREAFPFAQLTGEANVFVFPNLDAANIGYKLIWRLGRTEVIGPVLLGMQKAVNVLQTNASVDAIVNLAAVTALRAQEDEFPF